MKAILIGSFIGVACIVTSSATAADYCTGISQTARSIMHARQNGADMAKLMEITKHSCDKETGKEQQVCKLMQPIRLNMIVDAYKISRYSSKEYQDRAASDFANNMYLACYEGTHKQ